MTKETNKNNKKVTEKNTKKKTEEKVNNTKPKATKSEKTNKEKKSEIRVIDTMEEAYEYDEDLEIEEIKKTSEEKKDTNVSQEKIKKIEKMAKEKKNKKEKTDDNLTKLLMLFEKYNQVIYAFIGGVFITTLIAYFIWPDRIAALKNGEEPIVKVGKNNYTADELYEDMKEVYSVNLLLDKIDNDLLKNKYPENDEMNEEVNSNAESYLNMYAQYGYTEEQFLERNGFANYNEFVEFLKLDYRRNKYLDDYIKNNLTNDEIKKYYEENVFGEINTQHILVAVSSNSENGLTDQEAKKLAEEIITKLNDGTSWETIKEEYKDKITFEDLGYQTWDAPLEESFMTALKNMEENTYSEEPVKTSYGYHIIYHIDQKETPTLKKVKKDITENLIIEKKSEDSDLLYKALIALREENNIDFKDTVMKSKYEKYCDQYK